MSDYLNNIVARSLSVAEVVQPRVPHLFEQSATATPVEAEHFAAGESAAETMISANETQQSSDPSITMSQISSEVTIPFLEQFRPAPAALPQPPMSAQEMSKRTTAPAATNESAIQERSVPLQTPESQQRRTASHNAARDADTVVPSGVGPTPVEPSVKVRRSEPVTPNQQPNAPNLHAPPSATPQAIRAEQQLPPIRINIGRVDVRAIMPVAPPVVPNSPRPKPALSLESYLKQREEGKR